MLRYDKQVVLQSNTPVYFRGGCKTESWDTVSTMWANVEYKNLAESYENVKGQQISNLQIVVRKTDIIDKATCRFLFESKIVHIESISDKGSQTIIKGRIDDES